MGPEQLVFLIPIVAILSAAAVKIAAIVSRHDLQARGTRPPSDDPTHDVAALGAEAERLQRRIEALERILDATQPEWRGKL
jgi:phage shock protein B